MTHLSQLRKPWHKRSGKQNKTKQEDRNFSSTSFDEASEQGALGQGVGEEHELSEGKLEGILEPDCPC